MRKSMAENALHFRVTAECAISKARVACMTLPHGVVDTPVFMPVGTQGTMKGVTPEQLKALPLDCQIMLGNTYHLGSKPGCDVLTSVGGLHQFMKWDRPLLTDSGGFQMVSLLKLAEITEEGVKFRSPHDDSTMLLTPEHSIEIQNVIGADIIMQLDDVVHSLTTGNRVEEAMWRTLRWLDRCINAHHYPNKQNLFGIVQGGLQPELRKQCIKEMMKRDLPGYAIGGLSGGEKKDIFWKIVSLCTDHLPRDKPRYCMGVGFPVDLVVCCALGVDMFDCVFPTRTARFGTALVPWGQLHLKQKEFEMDFQPIDSTCTCVTCTHYSRAALHAIINKDPVSCSLITLHNLTYHLSLMQAIRKSIIAGHFPKFVQEFMSRLHPSGNYEQWVIDALASFIIFIKNFHDWRTKLMWDGLHMDKERKDWAPLVVDYGEYDPLKVGSIDGTDLRPHDRAITRAIQAKYRPNKQVKGDYERTLFVGRLSSDTREDTIIDHFSKYGKIKNCRLVRDIITGQSKRYAFVEFKHQSDMKRALEKAHHILIDDKKIIVEQELERFLPGWKPRRFGGGLGGQKESGQLRFGGQGRPFKRPIVLGNQAQKYNNERRREWERQRRSCDSHGPKN